MRARAQVMRAVRACVRAYTRLECILRVIVVAREVEGGERTSQPPGMPGFVKLRPEKQKDEDRGDKSAFVRCQSRTSSRLRPSHVSPSQPIDVFVRVAYVRSMNMQRWSLVFNLDGPSKFIKTD